MAKKAKAKEEKKLEEDCCRIARKMGLMAMKIEKNSHTGAPDRIFVKRGGISIFIEFKNPNGKGILSDEQKFVAEYYGENYHIIASKEKFIELINKFVST